MVASIFTESYWPFRKLNGSSVKELFFFVCFYFHGIFLCEVLLEDVARSTQSVHQLYENKTCLPNSRRPAKSFLFAVTGYAAEMFIVCLMRKVAVASIPLLSIVLRFLATANGSALSWSLMSRL